MRLISLLVLLLGAMSAAASAAPLFFGGAALGSSLDREEAYGWQLDPSLLAQGPAWRVGLQRNLTSQAYLNQGYGTAVNGGDLVWGLGDMGGFGLAFSQMEASDFAPAIASTSLKGVAGRLGWGWAAGYGFSLGTGLTVGQLTDQVEQRSFTAADLAAHWTRWGQTLGAQAAYSNPGGHSQFGLSGHGRLIGWLGYHWMADWDQFNGGSGHAGLDTRSPLRLSVGYGNHDGLMVGLAFSWHGGHLSWRFGDRVSEYGLSWQAYTPSQAGPESAADNAPPAIPDVDPAPAAPAP